MLRNPKYSTGGLQNLHFESSGQEIENEIEVGPMFTEKICTVGGLNKYRCHDGVCLQYPEL